MDTSTDELDAWPARVSDAAEGTVLAALTCGARRAGRAGGLLAAAEAAALLGSRSARLLPGEAAVTAVVVDTVLPRLLGAAAGEQAAELGDADLLIDQFPVLVHAFAAETADLDAVAEAARPGRSLPVGEGRALLGRPTRAGCSVVQALPAAVRQLALLGAPAAVRERAGAVLAAGDELHRRMADVRTIGEPVARVLAEAYGLLYAAAACLHLWVAHAAAAAGRPLWTGAGWLRAALGELADRLHALLGESGPAGCPGDPERSVAYGASLAAAALTGGPLTPFG
ncbi:hypothetical protein [Kitasatospora mediocidica]|uniref:hypothetical protein n=1 Tax=Kitasatospora mediocidica TaxID=58352 RepID=UPI00055AEB9A|nr:hypothetical protein [Kitasatospora mediocidica]